MELGTQTGSLVNHVLSRSAVPAPTVGMGATILGWTDRHAGTIIEVNADGSFVVQRDHAFRTDKNGMSECQEYRYERNPEGPTYRYALVKRGKAKGQLRLNGSKDGYGVLIGDRNQYYDFSF